MKRIFSIRIRELEISTAHLVAQEIPGGVKGSRQHTTGTPAELVAEWTHVRSRDIWRGKSTTE